MAKGRVWAPMGVCAPPWRQGRMQIATLALCIHFAPGRNKARCWENGNSPPTHTPPQKQNLSWKVFTEELILPLVFGH